MKEISENIRANRAKFMRNYAAKSSYEIAQITVEQQRMGLVSNIPAMQQNVYHCADTSFWNGVICPSEFQFSNPIIRAFYAKATEGTSLADAQYPITWNASAGSTLFRGSYCFGRKGLLFKTQADWFCGHSFPDPHGLIVLDLEDTAISVGMSDYWQGVYIDYFISWFDQVIKNWGSVYNNQLAVYTGAWWINPRFSQKQQQRLAARVPKVIVADYYTDPNKAANPIMPWGWGSWHGWQYSSTAKVRGVMTNCDINLIQKV